MGIRSQRGINWEAAKQDGHMASLWRFLVASFLTIRYLWYDILYEKTLMTAYACCSANVVKMMKEC